MLDDYCNHVTERVTKGIPPRAQGLNQKMTSASVSKAPAMEVLFS